MAVPARWAGSSSTRGFGQSSALRYIQFRSVADETSIPHHEEGDIELFAASNGDACDRTTKRVAGALIRP